VRRVNLFILNEASFFPFLWSVILKRETYVESTEPVVPIFSWLIRSGHRLAQRFGRVSSLQEIVEDADMISTNRYLALNLSWVEKTLPVIDAASAGIQSGQVGADYGFAGAKVANNLGYAYTFLAKFLYDVLEEDPNLEIKLFGIQKLFPDVLAALNGIPDRLDVVTWRRGIGLINILSTVFVYCVLLWKVLLNINWVRTPVEKSLCIADVTPPFERSKRIIQSAVDEVETDVQFILRNANAYPQLREARKFGDRWADIDDIAFSPVEALSEFATGLKDGLAIFRVLWRESPTQFFQTIRLIYVAARFRGFCRRHEFNFYLGQDEMTPDHIIRSRELRKLGRASWGIVNGEALNRLTFVHRYIDYDITYLISGYAFRRYLHRYWPKNAKVRFVGSIRCVAADNYPGTDRAQSKSILFLLKPREEGDKGLVWVFELAKHLPDYRITIGFSRRGPVPKKRRDALDEGLQKLPSNVSVSDRNTYEMVYDHKYVVSTLSAMVLEAIHMRSMAFLLDFYPEDHEIIYRDFPSLCVSNMVELAEKIRDYDDGKQDYPWHEFEELSTVSGPGFPAVLKEDITALVAGKMRSAATTSSTGQKVEVLRA